MKMPNPTTAFVQLNELRASRAVTFLIYGPSKVGKTWLAGTCGDRMLYIYFKRTEGIATIQSKAFQDLVGVINPITVCIDEDNPRTTGFDATVDAIDYALTTFPEKFDWVVIDEATGFRRAAMIKGLALNAELGRSKTQDKMKVKGKDIFLPGIQDFGAEMNLTEWFIAQAISDCTTHGKHFAMFAHERHIFHKDGQIDRLVGVKPAFTGKTFPDDITAYFDNVFRMEQVRAGDKVSTRLHTRGDDVYSGGTRYSGVFDDLIIKPNMQDMVAKIQSSSKG
jgi:hypothetical protein